MRYKIIDETRHTIKVFENYGAFTHHLCYILYGSDKRVSSADVDEEGFSYVFKISFV